MTAGYSFSTLDAAADIGFSEILGVLNRGDDKITRRTRCEVIMTAGSATTAIAMTNVLHPPPKYSKTIDKLIGDTTMRWTTKRTKQRAQLSHTTRRNIFRTCGHVWMNHCASSRQPAGATTKRTNILDVFQEAFLLLCLLLSRTRLSQNLPKRMSTLRSGGWEKRTTRPNASFQPFPQGLAATSRILDRR